MIRSKPMRALKTLFVTTIFLLATLLSQALPQEEQATSSLPLPYATIVTLAEYGGFGIDVPGDFSSNKIQFKDAGPFENGIGAHPNSRIDFHLDVFRKLETFHTFKARVGIDDPSVPEDNLQGVRFKILLDNTPVHPPIKVSNVAAGSIPIEINVEQASTLSLITEYLGGINHNHGAWADAQLLGSGTPIYLSNFLNKQYYETGVSDELPIDEGDATVNYKVQLIPDPGISGKQVEVLFTLINPSKTQHLNNLNFYLSFRPLISDTTGLHPTLGNFLRGSGSPCSVAVTSHQQDYSYHCMINNLDAGKEQTLHFIQDKAIAGKTRLFVGRFSSDEIKNNYSPGDYFPRPKLIDIRAANPKLSVSIEFTKPLATGKRSEAFITITNNGTVPVADPTVDVEFSGKAIPKLIAFKEISKREGIETLRLTAGVEFLGGEKVSNIDIQWTKKGFITQIVNDKEPSLGPRDSRRIKISFMPLQGGKLNIRADVSGKSAEGKEVDTQKTESAEIEKPSLELDLISTNPPPYAHTQDPKRPLHKGNQITLQYFLWNTSSNATFENGYFEVNTGDGEILSLTSLDGKADCPKTATLEKTDKCKISKLIPDENTVISVTILYHPPNVITGVVHNVGSYKEYFYTVGADIDPVVHAKFNPVPMQKLITPETEITAQFTVRNLGQMILKGGELRIYPPDQNLFPGFLIKKVTGCKIQWVEEELSDVYHSVPYICGLDDFSFKNPARLLATFEKIPGNTLNQDLIIAWDLELPPVYDFKPSDQTRGSIAYKIVPKFVDLSVEGYEDLGKSVSGKIEETVFLIRNNGSVPQGNVTLNIDLQLARTEEYDESLPGILPFPGGKDYLDWFRHPTVNTSDLDGQSLTIKCDKRPGRFSQFHCPLGTLSPGNLALGSIEWDQDLPAGVTYSYKAWFKKNGQGEGELGGSLDDNSIMGHGTIVTDKGSSLEDTECTVQEPNGQITISSPREGSKVWHGTSAHGSFDSIPIGMEIWVYTWAPSANKYFLKPARKYGETSGTWTVKALEFGRPGKADIGFIYSLGVVLADQCTSDNIRLNPNGFVFLPEEVKDMVKIQVNRVGE